MTARSFRVKITEEGAMATIPIPFDPKEAFGKVRAPVRVTVNGHTYPTTIFSMRGEVFVPFRSSHRQAAGIEGGETVEVRVELDEAERVVTPPADLLEALNAMPPALERWEELSYTHQREYAEAVEGAKKPETRARRIEQSVRAIAARPPRKGKR